MIPLSSTERVDIEMLFSECCWDKDNNPDQFGRTKMENWLRYVWRVRIMGSGPRKVQQKKHLEQPLLFCIKRKILETSKLLFQFPKQTILPLVKYKWDIISCLVFRKYINITLFLNWYHEVGKQTSDESINKFFKIKQPMCIWTNIQKKKNSSQFQGGHITYLKSSHKRSKCYITYWKKQCWRRSI